MTDEQIIKALESCIDTQCDACCQIGTWHEQWNCMTALMRKALELINRQKDEIEHLRAEAYKYQKFWSNSYNIQEVNDARDDAIKEFANNLKQDVKWHRTEMMMNGLKGTPRTNELTYETIIEYIDNLVKEMTRNGEK